MSVRVMPLEPAEPITLADLPTGLTSDPIRQARETVAAAAAELAIRCVDASDQEAPDIQGRLQAVKVASEAVSNVAFGAQGGAIQSQIETKGALDTRYDYAAERKPAGFAP